MKKLNIGGKERVFKKGIKQSFIFEQLYFERKGIKLSIQEYQKLFKAENIDTETVTLFILSCLMAGDKEFSETFDTVMDWMEELSEADIFNLFADEQVGNS